MRPGELRKFRDDVSLFDYAALSFLVLRVYHFEGAERLDMLMGGELFESWLHSWVEMNSELISETR